MASERVEFFGKVLDAQVRSKDLIDGNWWEWVQRGCGISESIKSLFTFWLHEQLINEVEDGKLDFVVSVDLVVGEGT